jgi:hypothetical protein
MESLDSRAKYVAHVFSGEQVIDRVSARTMATLLFHVRNVIADDHANTTPKRTQPKATNSEAPKPKTKASKKPTATTAPVVESVVETTETEVTE